MKRQSSLDAAAISAVCLVIRQAGYSTLAQEFRTAPQYRERIVKIVAADLARNYSVDMAERFTRNAAKVLA